MAIAFLASTVTAGLSTAPRHIEPRAAAKRIVRTNPDGPTLTVEGPASVSCVVAFKPLGCVGPGPGATMMSVGPYGPVLQDTTKLYHQGYVQRLRVTDSPGRFGGLSIEVISDFGEEGCRIVSQYFWGDMSPASIALNQALAKVPRGRSYFADKAAIEWTGPSSFRWVRGDTLCFEQLGDSLFKVTHRASVR